MDDKKENSSSVSATKDKECATIYGLVIYNRGDAWKDVIENRKKAEALLALLTAEKESVL